MPLERLDPDDTERYFAMHYVLKPCPFCGDRGPLLHTFVNKEPMTNKGPVYQAKIACNECYASVFVNSLTIEEARTDAVKRWQSRPSAPKADVGGEA